MICVWCKVTTGKPYYKVEWFGLGTTSPYCRPTVLCLCDLCANDKEFSNKDIVPKGKNPLADRIWEDIDRGK